MNSNLPIHPTPKPSLTFDSRTYKIRIKKIKKIGVSASLRTHGLYIPWNFPGQNTRRGSLSLL